VMYRQPGAAMGKAGRDPAVAVPLGIAVEAGAYTRPPLSAT